MHIKVSKKRSVRFVFSKIKLPKEKSYKGQNGKILIIGGSSLFHAASIWAAEVASHFVDMVHYSSTIENERLFYSLKKIFRNGIVVPQKELENYIKEDDVTLLGPGMVRQRDKHKIIRGEVNLKMLVKIKNEAEYTRNLTHYLINNFSNKKFVFDAGALQMMDVDWLLKLKTIPIITPHLKEFETLFDQSIDEFSTEKKVDIVKNTAAKFKVVILLKAVDDIISDGKHTVIVEGGNAGLTKGGTGDVLSGLVASFFVHNNPLDSAIAASALLKLTGEKLFKSFGYWYNINDIIKNLPQVMAEYHPGISSGG